MSHCGIDVNPKKLWAILEMTPYRSRKEVQCLVGWVVVLSQFIARSNDKCLSFFKTLRQIKEFKWTEECQATFE